jgi:hypothetical protein
MKLANRTYRRNLDIDQSLVDGVDMSWKNLYKFAGVAAAIIVFFTVVQVIVFIANPQPGTVEGWFTLFHENKLIGLVDMDLLLVADNVLAIPIFLAFYFTLKRSAKSAMVIAVALGLAGAITYFASSTAFQMLSLSNLYAAATTEAQKSMLLASGQSMLAIYEGTAFYTGSFIGTVALLIVSIVMLRNNVFGKATACLGITANVLGFGLFIPHAIGLILSIVSVLFLAIWWIMIALRLFRMERFGAKISSPAIVEEGA